MTAAQTILTDAARRAPALATLALNGISTEAAHASPGGRQNPIAWLIWHAARQQDYQVAQLAGTQQVWSAEDWAARTGVARGGQDIGFGDSPQDVSALRVTDLDQLAAYLTAVVEATVTYIQSLTDAALEEVIDTSWEPPVTRGARLVSTIDDAAQHLGQAAYARALVQPGWSAPY